MVTGVWDYYSKITPNKSTTKLKQSRSLVDMTSDKNGNVIETYSDWSKRTLDKKWNIISDNAIKNSWVKASQIQNWSKAWDQWDYMADVSKDKNRATELVYNLKQYAETNPQLFKNWNDFKKYFHFDERSTSQQELMQKAFNNYNKYWLNSNENEVADNASQLAAEKWNAKVNQALDTYNKWAANLKKVYDTMSPKYQNLINKYDNLYNKVFDEIAELKKLATDYYNHTKAMYDEQSAGEAAGVESRLSAQWLWYTAIGSATTWVGNQWAKRYNDLMSHYLDDRMKLMQQGWTLQTTILNWMWDLTDKQKDLINSYMTWLNDLYKAVDQEQQAAIDWIYAPYEAITWAKVTGTAEKAQSQAEKTAGLANYDAASEKWKVQILLDYLWVDENTELSWDYYNALLQIVKKYPNDRAAAKSAADALYNKLNKKTSSWWWNPKWDWKLPTLAEILKDNPNASYEDVLKINNKISKDDYEKATQWKPKDIISMFNDVDTQSNKNQETINKSMNDNRFFTA